MFHFRFSLAFLFVTLASNACFAQTPVVKPIEVTPLNTIDDGPVSVLATETDLSSADKPIEPQATAASLSPAPEIPAPVIPAPDATSQTETTVLATSPVNNNSYRPQSSVYSPQRDGLPTLEQRRQLRAMPIQQRPNRRFHFYGNTVRRRMGR